jgi:4-hydroxy-tetrahydrodipicolinate reductase
MSALRTIHFGVGAIGAGIARLVAERPNMRIVGAVDLAPDKAGRDLGQVAGLEKPLGVMVTADAAEVLQGVEADVVLHSTGSYLPEVQLQLLAAVRAGRNVVSTCEELAFPWHRHPELARALDEAARQAGVTVVGTGINPGFVMDTLVLALSAASQRVDAVRAARIVDVGMRREQLQRKVGVSLSVEEFRRRAASGRFGHVGLKESAWLVAASLGWELDGLEETLDPVVASEARETPCLSVRPGQAAGQHQVVRGTMGGREVLTMTVEMSVGAERPRDEIVIEGSPAIRAVLEGGIPGDQATASVVVNAIPSAVEHAPGLVTMADLPLITAGPGVGVSPGRSGAS